MQIQDTSAQWSMDGKDVATCPIEDINMSDAAVFQRDEHLAWFKRLRQEAPVHYCKDSAFGPFWSITKMEDVIEVDKDHKTFSASPFGIIGDTPEGLEKPAFIFMDPPEHEPLRMAVQPVVAPKNLKELEGLIRERVAATLDALPVGEAFNWVDKVSIELTSKMLATLLGYPIERRRELIEVSELSVGSLGANETEEHKAYRLDLTQKTYMTFRQIWEQRLKQPPAYDLISLMQQAEATKDLIDDPESFLSNLGLLIVGGNDTTRNSITGGVLALNQNPQEYDKLRNNVGLIPKMVSEIIRWQTPILHHRRTATKDVEFGGQTIKKGDQVIMWWISANRDDAAIEHADQFIIDRKNPRFHASFGFGVHRCMGNRLAELQLKILWEEIMKRFDKVEVVGEPVRLCSNHFNGYTDLPVVLHPK